MKAGPKPWQGAEKAVSVILSEAKNLSLDL